MSKSTSSPANLCGQDHGRENFADFDAVVVGAGFGGLYMLYRLRKLGLRACAIEAGTDVGGTWYWNRYPGARCDVESMQYSYSFSPELEQEWRWTEIFASQPEILAYANHVAERFDLRRNIRFETRVTEAQFDEENQRWRLSTEHGDRVTATYCIMATGLLSSIHPPEIKDFNRFEGEWFHTGVWPHRNVDLGGKVVGVIGTGSSGVQTIPVVAEEAKHLFVFQRTPNYILPSANRAMTEEYARYWKSNYKELRLKASRSRTGVLHNYGDKSALEVTAEERDREYTERWNLGSSILAAYTDIYYNLDANRTAADFLRARIRMIVRDPAVAEMLSPKSYPIGAKRVCIDTNYFETFNRPNVELVDIRSQPIEAFTADGLRTSSRNYELDAIIFATGFDAVTGALSKIDIRGRKGERLADKWIHGPTAYLGLMAAGFPNLFIINGPGSPAALSNALMSIEHHVDWIVTCIEHLRATHLSTVEPSKEAEDEWMKTVAELGAESIFAKADSWFNGANVVGKPRTFLVYVGGVNNYRAICDEVTANGFRGFHFTSVQDAVSSDPSTRKKYSSG